MQLANTPPLQSTTPGLHPVSIQQTSPTVRGSKHPITAYYSIYQPRKYEKLSRPGWLVTYRNKVPPPGVEPGHVTHPSTNWARRRVTSLIRRTPLPLRHAANQLPTTPIKNDKIGVSELQNPVTNCHRIWHRWLRWWWYHCTRRNWKRSSQWGRPGKWVKYYSRKVLSFSFLWPQFLLVSWD